MARAPHIAGWEQSGGQFSPTLGGGSRGGQPFLPNVLSGGLIWVEMAFGAVLTGSPDAYPWVEVTADVMYASQVNITQGRADETSQAQAAQCTFSLLNTGNKYTPYNPTATFWPNVKRGTPVRVRVDVGTGAYTLFQGSMVGATPGWDTSTNLATVDVVAAGATRRLGQGRTPLRTPLYRASIAQDSPLYYWPMEDGSSATSCQPAVGAPSLVKSGSVTLASSGPGGSLPLPNFTSAGQLSAPITGAGSTANGWQVSFAFQSDNVGVSDFLGILGWHTTGNQHWWVSYIPNSNVVNFSYLSPTVSSGTASFPLTLLNTAWHSVQIRAANFGGDLHYGVWIDGNGTDSRFVGEQMGTLTSRVTVNPFDIAGPPVGTSFRLGHLEFSAWNMTSIFDVTPHNVTTFSNSVTGFTGETATTRVARLCSEEGVPVNVIGTATTGMGPQSQATFMDLLRECETTDGGFLYDGFSSGVAYNALSSRYNAPAALTADATLGQVSIPFAPVDDDQRNRNDVTASRNVSSGSSARFVDSTGPLGTAAIGTYDTSVTVNTATDDPLLQIAAWLVHLGTVQGLRIPALALDFTATPGLIQAWLDAPFVGFPVAVNNIVQRAVQAPPDNLSLVVEGYTQTISTLRWTVSLNTSPGSPYGVGVLDSAMLGHLDTAGCVLDVAGWDGAAGTFLVDTSSGPLWTTSAGDYPFDLNVGGQRVTVSGCSGASNPQTFTVAAASVNGVSKIHPGGEPVSLWQPLVMAL